MLPNASSRSAALLADEPWSAYQPQAIGGATPPVIDLSSGVLAESGHDGDATGLSGGATESGPAFDPTTERNVTVLVGRTAHLHCRVRNLGNRTVSETALDTLVNHRS